MTVVTPTDRPKSVRKRCVIEILGGVFVLSIGFRIFCWYEGFCHKTESDLLFYVSIIFTRTCKVIKTENKQRENESNVSTFKLLVNTMDVHVNLTLF